MRKISLLAIFLVLASYSVLCAQELPVVNSIEIKGLKRIEEGAVKAKLSNKIGEPISQEKTNEDISTIFKIGYFDDIKVEVEPFEGGVRLFYIIKEKPTIIRVEFQGNKALDNVKLKEKLTITPGSIADTVLIQDNAAIIGKIYEEEGYWLSNIVPVVKKISEDEVSLTYQIDEGTKVKLKNILFEGNKGISSKKIKKVMDTKEWQLFSFVTSSGYYKKDQMANDLEKIKHLYFDNGYIKVITAEPEIIVDRQKKGMTIKIRISEGIQYKISSINFAGNKAYDNAAIQKRIQLAPNVIFRKSLLEKDMSSISGLYSENGYALVSVVPDLSPDDSNKTVAVTLNIDEGDKYRIGRIEISGNTKTRDKVIRREIRLAEGDTFDSLKLKRSYERINNLNFFDTVEMVPKPKYEEKAVDLDVKVKERPTGFLSVGGGYSSVDKFIATVDLTQGNLFGKGQYIKVKGELGTKSSFYELSFRDPYFLDTPYAFSTGIYQTTREYIEYDKKATGFYLGLGKSLAEYWRTDVSYNYEKATIHNVDAAASAIIKDQAGTKTTSSITPSLVRDSRDNYLDPSKGSRNSAVVTFAGLGGSNAFIKGVLDSTWYFPLGETAFMFRGRFGYAKGIFNKTLPLYERFYVGGLYTVRGLDFGKAGPKDPVTGEPIGGSEELVFNAEYIFPLLPDMKVKGVVFFDAGNAYEDFHNFGSLRYTSGLGFRWISPIGPIRLEWGYNINKEIGEGSSKFEFAFGTFF
ncbi:MAG: outer membrane protein assembly factor BamA [Nitrospira bacterium HGW-Nitrospira-1]|nr:MAG: outer membrane protein assembly factor BamA [Nitrospira bacterium HGW-Nitrospira-1]